MDYKTSSFFGSSTPSSSGNSLNSLSVQDLKLQGPPNTIAKKIITTVVKEVARVAFSHLKTALIGLAGLTAFIGSTWAFTILFISAGVPLTTALCTTLAMGLLGLICIKIACQNTSNRQAPLEIPANVIEALAKNKPWEVVSNQQNSFTSALEFKFDLAPGFRFIIENPTAPGYNKETFELDFFGKFLAVTKEAAEICQNFRPNQLIIPRVTTFKIGDLRVFAEEIPPHDPRPCAQHDLYRTKSLKLALKQLTTLAAKMNFTSVNSDHIRIDQEGKIILTHLLSILRSKSPNFGSSLIYFLGTEEQINIVIDTTLEQTNYQQRISLQHSLDSTKEIRLQQLAQEQRVAIFHQTHGIRADNAFTLIDKDTALRKIEQHLDLDAKCSIVSTNVQAPIGPLETQITFRDITKAIISELNNALQKNQISRKDCPLDKKRQIEFIHDFKYFVDSSIIQNSLALFKQETDPRKKKEMFTHHCYSMIFTALKKAKIFCNFSETIYSRPMMQL